MRPAEWRWSGGDGAAPAHSKRLHRAQSIYLGLIHSARFIQRSQPACKRLQTLSCSARTCRVSARAQFALRCASAARSRPSRYQARRNRKHLFAATALCRRRRSRPSPRSGGSCDGSCCSRQELQHLGISQRCALHFRPQALYLPERPRLQAPAGACFPMLPPCPPQARWQTSWGPRYGAWRRRCRARPPSRRTSRC